MLLIGFFTAMLWRRTGLKSLLRNRLKKGLFPCLVGLITVVPAIKWAASFGSEVCHDTRQAASAGKQSTE